VKNQQHEPTSEPTKENEVSVLKWGRRVWSALHEHEKGHVSFREEKGHVPWMVHYHGHTPRNDPWLCRECKESAHGKFCPNYSMNRQGSVTQA
jgi:hypothetical protein